jgi:hypothetical protein
MGPMRALQRRHRATPADGTRALTTGGRDLTPAGGIRQLTIVPISSTSRNLANFRPREITQTLRPRAIDRRRSPAMRHPLVIPHRSPAMHHPLVIPHRSPAMHHPLVIRRRCCLVIRWALPAAARLTGHNRDGHWTGDQSIGEGLYRASRKPDA